MQVYRAANMAFCASGADGITIGFLFFIILQFGQHKHRWAFVPVFIACFPIVCGSKLTFF